MAEPSESARLLAIQILENVVGSPPFYDEQTVDMLVPGIIDTFHRVNLYWFNEAKKAYADAARLKEELHQMTGLWYGACAARTEKAVALADAEKKLAHALTPVRRRSVQCAEKLCAECHGYLAVRVEEPCECECHHR